MMYYLGDHFLILCLRPIKL